MGRVCVADGWDRPKRVIPGDMGVVAYFTDTEENVMGLWSQK